MYICAFIIFAFILSLWNIKLLGAIHKPWFLFILESKDRNMH